MAYRMAGRSIEKVAVIGSGQIGPDIAFYFSKVLGKYGVPVVVVDVAEDALANGSARTRKKLDKGVEQGAFKPAVADAIFDNLTFTTDYDVIKGAGLVIEAATEDLAIKHKIVAQLENLVADDTIIASNSSHMEPEVIFGAAKNKARTAVVHYFFPAERNLVVEVVPGEFTDPAVAQFLMGFYEQIGKMPIQVGSRYGYAVDPIFEGLFQAAALCVEEGLCDVVQADATAHKALGLGVGPFTAMNLTGGNPITHHGLNEMHHKVMPWFKTPKLMDDQLKSGAPWPMAGRGEEIVVPDDVYQRVSERLLGAYFGLVCEVLDAGISNVADLNLAVEMALVVKAPFALMNKLGVDRALQLVQDYAKLYDGFRVSEKLKAQAASGKPWQIPVVLREDRGMVAIVKIRRPKVLNALSAEVIDQLEAHFDDIAADKTIKGVVLTGFGTKAFVAGADIRELAATKTKEEGVATATRGQEVFSKIENSRKPVVAAMNGLAFGGGNELAMACTMRLARENQPVFIGQPEPNLGIIPGYGGTQRLPRLVGLDLAWKMLRDAKPISSDQAHSWGLVRKQVPGEQLLEEAIVFVRDILTCEERVRPTIKNPIPIAESFPPVDIGHLSTRIDELLQEAILQGAATTLDEGLKIEAEKFGECILTKDTRIGLKNFIENGPRAKAKFVHE